MSGVETGTIKTDVPARLDRLPWARWHWLVVIGLGTVWILDGLEVTIVGSMSDALKPESTGLGMSSADIGLAGAIYVAGACIGALFFGQLTDRRKNRNLLRPVSVADLPPITRWTAKAGPLARPSCCLIPRSSALSAFRYVSVAEYQGRLSMVSDTHE